MFELIERERRAGHRKLLTVVISVVVHVVVVGVFIIVPLLYVTDQLPTPSDVISAFSVNAAPPAPPPPPPPPAPSTPPPKAVATTGQRPLTPVEAPPKIETPTEAPAPATSGVPGGVPGGIAGGVTGGIVGGIPEAAPAPAPQAPVRVGGQIKAPAQIRRVEPQYPPIAQSAHVAGVVVLEATVDTSGRVQSVHVLRGIPLLNEAAIEAVKQWRYSPLMLNGRPTPFILTVTVTFALQ